jgi:hypothetical protein
MLGDRVWGGNRPHAPSPSPPRLGWPTTIGSSRSFHYFRMQRMQAIMTKSPVAQPVAAKNVVGHEANGIFAG